MRGQMREDIWKLESGDNHLSLKNFPNGKFFLGF